METETLNLRKLEAETELAELLLLQKKHELSKDAIICLHCGKTGMVLNTVQLQIAVTPETKTYKKLSFCGDCFDALDKSLILQAKNYVPSRSSRYLRNDGGVMPMCKATGVGRGRSMS